MTWTYALTSKTAMKRDLRDCPPLTTKSLRPIWASAPSPVNSSIVPILGRHHECLSLSFSCGSAVGQPRHSSIGARVLGAHTRSSSFYKDSMSILSLDVYRALLAISSPLSQFSSPAVMVGFHGVRLAFPFSAFSPSNVKSLNRKKPPKMLCASAFW